MKKNSFEYNMEEIDKIINSLENGELTLENSIKEYEKAMKLLTKSSELLDEAQEKIIKVSLVNDNLVLEEE